MVKAGAWKPKNMSKTAKILQKPDEFPSEFYKRLREVFQVYTPFNLEARENKGWQRIGTQETLIK